MVSATFRFYEELNDFLPRERRGCAFTVPCARAATTRHMSEALGVPHTEVEPRPVAKADVVALLPESVRLGHDEFTRCDRCGRAFWKGSHHKRMAAMLDGVTAAVESTTPPQPGPR